MKWMIGALAVLFAIGMVAQQQNLQPDSEKAPPAVASRTMMSNSDVRYALQSTFDTAPEFNGTRIRATVDNDRIVLKGYVYGYGEKEEALRLASKYAGNRQIVDWILMGGSPYGGRR